MTDKIVIPEGRRPEEFLRDAELAVYHQQQLDAAAPHDPDYAAKEYAARKAALAAALTADAVADSHAAARAELAKANKSK